MGFVWVDALGGCSVHFTYDCRFLKESEGVGHRYIDFR